MKPVATVAVSALVGAAAAIAVGMLGLDRLNAPGKRMVHAHIFLDSVSGECMIHTFPQTLEAFRKERIQWTIFDRCGVTNSSDVQIAFTGQDPLDTSCVPRGRRNITCSLKNAVDYGTYKYSVSANGAQTEDPELEIVQ